MRKEEEEGLIVFDERVSRMRSEQHRAELVRLCSGILGMLNISDMQSRSAADTIACLFEGESEMPPELPLYQLLGEQPANPALLQRFASASLHRTYPDNVTLATEIFFLQVAAQQRLSYLNERHAAVLQVSIDIVPEPEPEPASDLLHHLTVQIIQTQMLLSILNTLQSQQSPRPPLSSN